MVFTDILSSVDKRVTWGELISNAYPSQSGTYSVGFLGTLDVELFHCYSHRINHVIIPGIFATVATCWLTGHRSGGNAYPSQSGTYSVGFLGTLDVELSSILVEELGADQRDPCVPRGSPC
jgi:hypothetical protein